MGRGGAEAENSAESHSLTPLNVSQPCPVYLDVIKKHKGMFLNAKQGTSGVRTRLQTPSSKTVSNVSGAKPITVEPFSLSLIIMRYHITLHRDTVHFSLSQMDSLYVSADLLPSARPSAERLARS